MQKQKIIIFFFITSSIFSQSNHFTNILTEYFEDGDYTTDPAWELVLHNSPGDFSVVQDPLDLTNKVLRAKGPSYTAHDVIKTKWDESKSLDFSKDFILWRINFLVPVPDHGADGENDRNEFSLSLNLTEPTTNEHLAFGITNKHSNRHIYANIRTPSFTNEEDIATNIPFIYDEWMQLRIKYNPTESKFYFSLYSASSNSLLYEFDTDLFGVNMGEYSTTNYFHIGFETLTYQYVNDIEITLIDDGSLVAFYPFYGSAYDKSGYGNNGAVHGADLTADRFEDINSAYYFNGDNKIIVPNNSEHNFNDENFSIVFWVYQDSASTSSSDTYIMKLDPIMNTGFLISYSANDQRLQFGTRENGIEELYTADSDLIDGQWHQIVCIRDNVTNRIKVYVDKATLIDENTSVLNLSNNSDLAIGYNPTDNSDSFWGRLDDISFYNKALSENEINELFHLNDWNGNNANIIIGSVESNYNSVIKIIIDLNKRDDQTIEPTIISGNFKYNSSKLKFVSLRSTQNQLFFDNNWFVSSWDNTFGTIGFNAVGICEINESGTLFELEFQIVAPENGETTITLDIDEWQNNGIPWIDSYKKGKIKYTFNGEVSQVRGDANLDWSIDIGDVLSVIYHLYLDVELEGQSRINSDADLDNEITIIDAIAIVFRIAFGNWEFDNSLLLPETQAVFQEPIVEFNNNVLTIPLSFGNSTGLRSSEFIVLIDTNKYEYIGFESNDPHSAFMEDCLIEPEQSKICYLSFNDNVITDMGNLIIRKKENDGDFGGINISYNVNEGKVTGSFELGGEVTTIDNSKVSFQHKLYSNYPNPFNPSTIISFSIPEQGFVSLKVFNLLGEEVKSIVKEELSSGNYNYEFNAAGLANGIYLYQLRAGNFFETKKMLLLK
ncbi:MAG: T9SS type A sorting domain-containing protein [Ignavibacteriales bacterium]|nr:T9SS type A sorting domain-containing protein [Ignavibacteriales bacterium]